MMTVIPTEQAQTPGATATRVFPPTLTPSDQQHLAELLAADRECERPCYLGIIPGQTTFSQARAILAAMVGDLGGPWYYAEGLPIYGGDLSVRREDSPHYGVGHSVDITVSDEEIRRIVVFVDDRSFGGPDQALLSDFWASYSLREIFARYGEPDRLLIHVDEEGGPPGYSLLVLYETLGLAMTSDGSTSEDATVCPQMAEGGEVMGLRISIVDPASGLNPVSPNWVPTSSAFWSDTDETLGVEVHTFYQRILQTDAPCFTLRVTPG